MIVTEDEAKTKQCCKVGNTGLFAACLGSGCMGWRWQPLMANGAWIAAVQQAAKDISDESSNRAKAAKHVNENRAQYGLPTAPTHGYCGREDGSP